MKIECISQPPRPGGTHVEIDGTRYHFKPETAGGPHVAEVTTPAHIKRLLSIVEGYSVSIEDGAPAAPADDAPAQPIPPGIPRSHPPVEEPPADDPQDEAPIPPVPAIDADAIDTMDRAALVRLYEAREGRKPNAKTTDETLREKLKELARA